MKLPNADQATIDPRKIRDYLLSPNHPVGRFKAAFFAQLGYTSENAGVLEAALRSFARGCDAQPGKPTPYGQKFQIRSILIGPNGRSAEVISVWILITSEPAPRFVTVFPAG